MPQPRPIPIMYPRGRYLRAMPPAAGASQNGREGSRRRGPPRGPRFEVPDGQPPRSLPRMHAPPRHHAVRRDVPAARSHRAALLRDPRRAVRGLPPALSRPRADRDARPRGRTLRLRDRERSRPPGAGLVQRGLPPRPGGRLPLDARSLSGRRARRSRPGTRGAGDENPKRPRPSARRPAPGGPPARRRARRVARRGPAPRASGPGTP